jgi:hypothetical protein
MHARYLNLQNIEKVLERCDVITYWTWSAGELTDLEQNFHRLEDLMPHTRKVLGCYMWDYGDKKPCLFLGCGINASSA